MHANLSSEQAVLGEKSRPLPKKETRRDPNRFGDAQWRAENPPRQRMPRSRRKAIERIQSCELSQVCMKTGNLALAILANISQNIASDLATAWHNGTDEMRTKKSLLFNLIPLPVQWAS